MHLGIPALLEFYRKHCSEESLVLATVIETEGSTYRKPGAMMLISADGEFEGMISGGCLEGDLLHHAATVFASGKPAFITYDMHADDDLVWSLGLGCDGIINLLLQRLDRDDDFAFLKQLEDSFRNRRSSLLAIVTSKGGTLPPGSCGLLDNSDISDGEELLLSVLRDAAEDWPSWRFRRVAIDDGDGMIGIMVIHVPRQTRVLVCGAGPDAVPVVQALTELDWDIQVVDHRPAFAKSNRFPEKCKLMQSRPERLHESVVLDGLDAVLIMSHHLENDAAYLREVLPHEIPYLGVLGPRARREKLREMSSCDAGRLHGPVGLDIGAELPSAIALSVAAEIHAVLNERDGRSLTLRADGAN